MRRLLIVVLTVVCLVGPIAAVLAEEATQTETNKMNADLKAEKNAMKAEKKAKKSEMKKLKKQQKQQRKAKKKEMKEKGGTPKDAVQTQGQEMNHSGPDLTPAVPDIPAPQAPGAR